MAANGKWKAGRQAGRKVDGSLSFAISLPLPSILPPELRLSNKLLTHKPLSQTLLSEEPKLGFPGGAVVENLPANAGDTGSSPGLGRSHMPRSNWTREPQLLTLRVWSLCPATGGAAVVRGPCTAMKSGPCTAMKSGPCLQQLEKALARNEDPTQPKINNK